jgi:hypothetical protein
MRTLPVATRVSADAAIGGGLGRPYYYTHIRIYMSKAKAGTIVNHRSAVTGKFVKASYAKTHKTTTVTEHNRRSAPVKQSRSK